MAERRTLAAFFLLALGACASRPGDVAALQIEQRPAEALIRITNSGPRAFTLHYSDADHFLGYNMLLVRFRDGAGRVLDDQPYTHGWWTPLALVSSIEDPRRGPPRRRGLAIPARGRIEMARDLAALTTGWVQLDPVTGPCEVQVMLAGYAGRRWSAQRIEVAGDWQPAPCPAVNGRRPETSPRRP
ncbi:MAG TPA: hypothetical protein VGO55_05090 [Allosphingosinicella sp.]|jgi:hypothetical protein|nr:hypothetical protein [Allosphingosinicella sp.]